MQIYFAPMEGVTKYVYRNAHHKYFDGVDRYFTPFIAANQNGKFRNRELADILPENNQGLNTVPQILTSNSNDFIETSKQLKELGYNEVNLNLGCPSGTVVTKKKGSGFLAHKEELKQFLEEIFAAGITDISIKTRIGKDAPDEFYDLIKIYNEFPLSELIIHPRVQQDFYKNTPNMEIFQMAVEESKHSLCYNGDIFTAADYEQFVKAFPTIEKVMMGRGLIANPALAIEIKQGKKLEKEVLKAFHKEVYIGYQQLLSGDRNVLFKMKEFWFYTNQMFTNSEKYLKKIRKSQRLADYDAAVASLFSEQEIMPDAGFHPVK